MDPWSVQVKYSNTSPLFYRNSFQDKSICWNFTRVGHRNPFAHCRFFEIRVSKPRCCNHANGTFIVKAMGKKNPGNSSSSSGNSDQPERDEHRGQNLPGGNKSNDGASSKPQHVILDWREFRATMFAREQAEIVDAGSDSHEPQTDKALGLKWAHPISLPETGSILVATEKLDGVRTFERTVVLLIRSGTRHPQEGPFGIVINRPLHKKMRHMKPNNVELATMFANCSLHFGGPLDANMFLLKTAEKSKLPGFEEVIPGLCFGARNSLHEAMRLVKKGVLEPQDFRFFVGYAGWQLDQLREEIKSNYWYVAACSANLVFGSSADSSEGLWEEILQLMGDEYSDLSRKPNQDM